MLITTCSHRRCGNLRYNQRIVCTAAAGKSALEDSDYVRLERSGAAWGGRVPSGRLLKILFSRLLRRLCRRSNRENLFWRDEVSPNHPPRAKCVNLEHEELY